MHGQVVYHVCVKKAHAKSGITVEFILDPELRVYTARIPYIPAYGEGKTEGEALADLREALIGYIEAFGMEDALQRLSTPISVQHLDISLADFAASS